MATVPLWMSDYAFDVTLDASGNATDWLQVRNFSDHSIFFDVPDGVNAVVRLEGNLADNAVGTGAGIDTSGNEPSSAGNLAFTGPGTYSIIARSTPINYIRLKLVSFSGSPSLAGINSIKFRGGMR